MPNEAYRALDLATRYGAVLSSMAEGVVFQDVDGRIGFCNARAEEILGLTADQMTGLTSLDPRWGAIHEDGAPFPGEAHPVAVTLRTGQPMSNVIMGIRKPDGSLNWISINSRLVPESADQPRAVVATFHEISDMVALTEELRASQRRYQDVFDGAVEAIQRVSSDGRILMANAASGRLLGYSSAKEMIEDLVDGPRQVWVDLEERRRLLSIAQESEHFSNFETRFRRRDGTLIWVSISGRALRSSDGQRSYETFISDITQRRKAEAALKESEERYRSIFEGATDPLMFFRADTGQILGVNAAAEQTYGYSTSEWLKLRVTDVSAEPDLTERAIADRVTDVPMRWHKKKGGEHFPVAVRNSAFEWNGMPVRLAMARDISDQVRIEKELLDSKALTEKMLATMNGLVIIVDLEGRIVRFNPACERLTGWLEAELVGRNFLDVLIPQDEERPVRAVFSRLAAGVNPAHYESELLTKDGGLRTIRWATSELRSAAGDIEFLLGVGIDVTEQRAAERRSRDGQRLESIGVLAGGIAHDFNNLLTPIIGYAGLLASRVDPDFVEPVQTIISCAESAAKLTRQLLFYAGKGSLKPARVDISEAVDQMVKLIQVSVPNCVDVVLNLRQRLPAILIDPGQFQQVIMNLVVNAGEAIGERKAGQVTVSTGQPDCATPAIDDIGSRIQPGRYVCVSVADSGSGIDASIKGRIFDPFFSTKFTGRGMGLASLAGIVRSVNGAVFVESTVGEGTTIRVYFPVIDENADATGSNGVKAGAGILVVDDEPAVRRFLATALRQQGYHVATAADGREALAVYRTERDRIHLLVTDVVMPQMGAGDLVPQLKTLQPELAVLLTSGYDQSVAEQLCRCYPGVSFLQKPYTPEQLLASISSMLKAHAERPAS